jgi:hypothetical protein
MRTPEEALQMDERISEALRQFDEVHAEVVAFVRACDEHDWRERTTVEGWRVGVVAHHIAVGYTTARGWIDHLRIGEPVPGDPDSHAFGNAEHAAVFDRTTKEETLHDLESNAAVFREFLVRIQPGEMEKGAEHGPAGGHVITVERMVRATAGHPRLHLENMRTAVEVNTEQAS